jgi:Zn-dependent peptidase ImmA (M78 family)
MAVGNKFGRPRKLSDYQRQEAIKRRADGETLAAISKSYGVSIAMISRLWDTPQRQRDCLRAAVLWNRSRRLIKGAKDCDRYRFVSVAAFQSEQWRKRFSLRITEW